MKFTSNDIKNLDKVYRLNLINSITGIKPANLIATRSKDGVDNVAIFSSVVHLGSNPAMIGFVMRPQSNINSDTYQNILDNTLAESILIQFIWSGIPTTLVLDDNFEIISTINGEITANEIFELTR